MRGSHIITLVAMQTDAYLKLIDDMTLHLLDDKNNIVARHKPIWTTFCDVKRIGTNCNIIKENDKGFPKNDKQKANIYCLDDNFIVRWIIDAPLKDDSFPNSIVWNTQTIRRQDENGYLTLDTTENPETFICASWHGITVTVEYETGRTINSEFTK